MPKPEAFPTGEASFDAPPEETDEALMTEYAQGDAVAFERLYARYKGPLYRYFLRQLSEPNARDCYQEAWLKLVRAKSSYTPSGSFKAYLFTLAHNVLMDAFRKQMRAPEVTPDDPEQIADGASVEATANRAEQIEHLHRILKSLPVYQREAWLLKQETGLTLKEIATLTKSGEEGVKSRLRYASLKLKAGMAAYAAE